MEIIKLRIGDVLEKNNIFNNSKSIGIVLDDERGATVKFDDGVELVYPIELYVLKDNSFRDYVYLGFPVYLVARGDNVRIKKKKD